MANAISMLSGGLKVKPAGVYHSGSAFGDGIYFANSFQKSVGCEQCCVLFDCPFLLFGVTHTLYVGRRIVPRRHRIYATL